MGQDRPTSIFELVGFGGGMVAIMLVIITNAAGGGVAAHVIFIGLALALIGMGVVGSSLAKSKGPPVAIGSYILGGVAIASALGLFGVCAALDSCWQESVAADQRARAAEEARSRAAAEAAAAAEEKRAREETRREKETARKELEVRLAKLRAMKPVERVAELSGACPPKESASCDEERIALLVQSAATTSERARLEQLAASLKKGNRRANASLECCDGTLSPSCLCGRPKRGCCSHHGGVCGCADE
jgi:hypothetical protein